MACTNTWQQRLRPSRQEQGQGKLGRTGGSGGGGGPHEVDVIERSALDGGEDDRRRRVRREADVADLALLLQLLRHLQAAALAQDIVELRRAVHTVEGEEVQVLRLEVAHRRRELGLELLRVALRRDLRLQDEGLARVALQRAPEVFLGAPAHVHPRRLKVVDAVIHRAVDERVQCGRGLVAHAAAREHRHLQARRAEAPRGAARACGRRWGRGRGRAATPHRSAVGAVAQASAQVGWHCVAEAILRSETHFATTV